MDSKTYHVRSDVGGGEDISCIGRWHDKVWDDGNCLDLSGPLKLFVMANAQRGFWGLFAGVNSTCRSR